jgi:hypothetical protein
MFRMKKVLLSLILAIPLFVHSQNDKVRKQNIISYNWPYFRLNGERLKYYEAKNEFSKVPAAQPYFKKYKPQLYIGLVSLFSSVVVLKVAENNQARTGKNNTGLYLAATGLSITSLITILSSIKNRRKAIKIYNNFYSSKN